VQGDGVANVARIIIDGIGVVVAIVVSGRILVIDVVVVWLVWMVWPQLGLLPSPVWALTILVACGLAIGVTVGMVDVMGVQYGSNWRYCYCCCGWRSVPAWLMEFMC